jgi:CheY-like chemotaxis protein
MLMCLGQFNQKQSAFFGVQITLGTPALKAHTYQTTVTINSVSVLVADHDTWARRSVSDVLTQAGFRVEQASNGMSALRMAQRLEPQLVLLGRSLPEIDTADVVQVLRNDHRTRNTAIVSPDRKLNVDGWFNQGCSPVELVATAIHALEAPRAGGQALAAAAPTRSVSTSF